MNAAPGRSDEDRALRHRSADSPPGDCRAARGKGPVQRSASPSVPLRATHDLPSPTFGLLPENVCEVLSAGIRAKLDESPINRLGLRLRRAFGHANHFEAISRPLRIRQERLRSFTLSVTCRPRGPIWRLKHEGAEALFVRGNAEQRVDFGFLVLSAAAGHGWGIGR